MGVAGAPVDDPVHDYGSRVHGTGCLVGPERLTVRGVAIHGYASVPTYPASHGCVRTPLWFAPGFYSRWDVGASVYVFA